MSGSFGNYEDIISYSRSGNGCTDGRLTVHGVVEEALRHSVSGGGTHGYGCVTSGGNMHHAYEPCSCREGARMHAAGGMGLESSSGALREYIRSNHRKIDKVNRSIGAKTIWSQVHPKVKHDGTFPKEFHLPKTVDDFKAMDISVIDRILVAYGLCSESSAGSDQRKSRQDVRNRKMWRLFEYLGADHLTPKHSEDDLHCSKHERFSGW